jgi:hypothetical protein
LGWGGRTGEGQVGTGRGLTGSMLPYAEVKTALDKGGRDADRYERRR